MTHFRRHHHHHHSTAFLPVASRRTNYINDVVFDGNGTVVASYSKHHLFPSESRKFAPGPYAPTAFALAGRVFGMIICYEVVRRSVIRSGRRNVGHIWSAPWAVAQTCIARC